MEKRKTLMDKDLTWAECLYSIDVFIVEEMTRRIDVARERFRAIRVGADYSPKTRVNSER